MIEIRHRARPLPKSWITYTFLKMVFHFSLGLPLRICKSRWKWQTKSVWRVTVEGNYFRAELTPLQTAHALPGQINSTLLGIVFVLLPTCLGAGCQGISQRGKAHDAAPHSCKMLNFTTMGSWGIATEGQTFMASNVSPFIILSELGTRKM